MKYRDARIRIGGLMRCCIETIRDFIEANADNPVEEGLILSCKYERPQKNQIRFKDGAFEWNRPADLDEKR